MPDAACTHIERAIAETTNDKARELLSEALNACRSDVGGVTIQGGGGGTTNPPEPPKKN